MSVKYYYVGGTRRREIIRRDYLVVGLFIILRGVEIRNYINVSDKSIENYYFRSSSCVYK